MPLHEYMEVARYWLWSPDIVSNQQLRPRPNVELFIPRTKVSFESS